MIPERNESWGRIDPRSVITQIHIVLPRDPRIPYGRVEGQCTSEVIQASVSCRPPGGLGEGGSPRPPAT
jgi:hypothetical protein